MIALTNLKLYFSIFNITEINKFKLHKLSEVLNDEGIYENVRIGFAKKLGISSITSQVPLDETKGPIINEKHRKTCLKRKRANPLITLLACFVMKVLYFKILRVFSQRKLI